VRESERRNLRNCDTNRGEKWSKRVCEEEGKIKREISHPRDRSNDRYREFGLRIA
jgi:hypothetical protein